jgi:hypothetical protein
MLHLMRGEAGEARAGTAPLKGRHLVTGGYGFELERLAERVAARFADPVIAHVAGIDVLGQQWRKQHVTALGAVRQTDMSSLGSGESFVQQHGKPPRLQQLFPLPRSPHRNRMGHHNGSRMKVS